MATDIEAIISNLEAFYPMAGKSVIHVGAGGGKCVPYTARSRAVIAVDPDEASVGLLREAVSKAGAEDRFEIVRAPFDSIASRADVVFFEFCLHEMGDPAAALAHARSLAPETLVADHRPDSKWAWYMCETELLARSWAAVRSLPAAREASFEAMQRFANYRELSTRLHSLGEKVLGRIVRLSCERDIRIEMPYGCVLIENDRGGLRGNEHGA